MNSSAALRLIAITDASRFGETFILERWRRLAEAAAPGSVAIDLREPALSTRALLEFGERLADVTRRSAQLLLVNDRVDVALLLGADGVHLREQSVETARVRSVAGPAFVVRACHDVERVAEVDADIVLLSPILEARKGNPALGGVDDTNAGACLRAGAEGVAVISAIFSGDFSVALLAALGIER